MTDTQLMEQWAREQTAPARDAEFDQWVRDEIIPGHEEYLADPSKAVPIEDALGRIKVRRAAEKEA
jgi:hypothetical protein